jgi:hypothetical protein
MPTLIRLFLVLAFLAGLGFAGMIALTVMVDPGEKDITVKIPARELIPAGNSDVIDLNDLPDPVNIVPRASSEPSSTPAGEDAADEANSEVETVEAPGRE